MRFDGRFILYIGPMDGSRTFGIRQVSELTGVSAATLRGWEQRFAFPAPARTGGGQRRYSADDVERLRAVTHARRSGMELATAVDQARRDEREMAPTVFALLRDHHGLPVYRLGKVALLEVARAVEDETLARAQRPVLIGGFQHERFYRQSEHRWHELARTAEIAVARAEFSELRERGGVHEIPFATSDPLAREWSVVSHAPRFGAALAGWEIPQRHPGEAHRRFEFVWSVEAAVVHEAALHAAALAAPAAPELADRLRLRLESIPPPEVEDVRALTGLGSRVIAYLAAAVEP